MRLVTSNESSKSLIVVLHSYAVKGGSIQIERAGDDVNVIFKLEGS
jgi:hypothetical protein